MRRGWVPAAQRRCRKEESGKAKPVTTPDSPLTTGFSSHFAERTTPSYIGFEKGQSIVRLEIASFHAAFIRDSLTFFFVSFSNPHFFSFDELVWHDAV